MNPKLAAFALAGLLAAGGAYGAAVAAPEDARFQVAALTGAVDFAEARSDTSDDGEFEDAAFGVDPMVTGPVSSAFRERREALGCDKAIWPDIPSACYPAPLRR